jgi:hypothetical protein
MEVRRRLGDPNPKFIALEEVRERFVQPERRLSGVGLSCQHSAAREARAPERKCWLFRVPQFSISDASIRDGLVDQRSDHLLKFQLG